MARLTASSIGFDMSSWDLSDIADGTVTYDSATKVDVDGSAYHYAILGTGLGDFDGSGFPQSGTVTGIDIEGPGHVATKITGISIDAASFMGFVNGNDANGLESTIFAGNTSFIGGAADDVLVGFGGNDKINVTEGGNDTVNGGAGNDTITFNAAFTAADQVDGGAGRDTVNLDGDYSTGVAFGADTMVNVELLKLGAGHTYNLTLNATSDTSGQSLEVYAAALSSANTLTLDGSAVAGTLRLIGGGGDDMLTGGSSINKIYGEDGNDTIIAGTGHNVISGGNGNDTMVFSNWNSGDTINGGAGTDTLVLDGDFSSGVTLKGAQTANIQDLRLTAGHSYDVTTDANTDIVAVDASALGPTDSLTFSSVTSTSVIGGAGNDVIHDEDAFTATIDLSHGGNDIVYVDEASDITIDFGGAFTADDQVQAVADPPTDDPFPPATVVLDGDYSAGVTLNADTLSNIAKMELMGGHSYSLTMNDANVAAGQSLDIYAPLEAGDNLFFDGSAETNGSYQIGESGGTFQLVGGEKSDDFSVGNGGTGSVNGGAGNDLISVDASFSSADSFNGGTGDDILLVNGDLSHGLTITSSMMTNIVNLEIGTTNANVTLADGDVEETTGYLIVTGDHLTLDASAVTEGMLIVQVSGGHITGSADNDQISGTIHDDYFTGGGGADVLSCDPYVDTLVYNSVSDSTSANYDTVIQFDPSMDRFHLWYAVSAVNASVTTGALSTATFDSDLAAAIGSSQLGAHDAVVFTPDSGTLAGDHFLIVDANGTAGYQAGQDLVMRLEPSNSSGLTFTTANFET
jgi:Ca2+-binding RTX toxin-like protein